MFRVGWGIVNERLGLWVLAIGGSDTSYLCVWCRMFEVAGEGRGVAVVNENREYSQLKSRVRFGSKGGRKVVKYVTRVRAGRAALVAG